MQTLLAQYGLLIVFVNVLLAQLGLPLRTAERRLQQIRAAWTE